LNVYFISVILGIVEGLTEFLPVSSTAHLRLSEALLHISLSDGYWKMYSIVIQLGAILCLPVYFWSRITKFLSTFPRGESGNRTALTHPLGLTIVAFVVTAIPSFLRGRRRFRSMCHCYRGAEWRGFVFASRDRARSADPFAVVPSCGECSNNRPEIARAACLTSSADADGQVVSF